MFDKILAVVLICFLLHACTDDNKTCIVPVEQKIVEIVPIVKIEDKSVEVVIETTPIQYISDCMLYLKSSEEECRKNWTNREEI